MERIGKFHSSAADIVNLFENPYLIEAVNNSWDIIKKLIEAGVSLKGKNIVRLKWDLDKEIKKFISDQENMDKTDGTEEFDKVDNYVSFIKRVKSKGYNLIPDAEELIERFTEYEERLESSNNRQEEIEKEIGKFGKRRKHYLDRIRGKK